MGLASGGEVASAQDLLMEACLAQEQISKWRAALKLHVQVLEVCKNSNYFVPPSEWAGWLQWSSCSQSCGLGRRERTRICSHSQSGTNSTEAISSDGSGSVSENPSGDSDQSAVVELINEAPDYPVEDSSSGQENEESEDIISGNSSGDSASSIESVEEPEGRQKEDGGIQDPGGYCVGEMNQMEDCQERKCPGLLVGCEEPKWQISMYVPPS